MATWIEEESEELGRSILVSKFETKLRTDFDLGAKDKVEVPQAVAQAAGAQMSFILHFLGVIRPLQRMVQDHADAMVEQGIMSVAEAASWINLHWDLIATQPGGITGGGAIMCYGRERRTRMAVQVKEQSLAGYTRLRLKVQTFLLARSGAGENEQDLSDLAGYDPSGRRRESYEAGVFGAAPENDDDALDLPTPAAGSFEEAVAEFGDIGIFDDEDEDDDGPAAYADDEKWVKAVYDPDGYELVLEEWDTLKQQKLGDADPSDVTQDPTHQRALEFERRQARDDEDNESEDAGAGDEADEADDGQQKKEAIERANTLANKALGAQRAAGVRLDADKMAKFGDEHANKKSTGYCARYTRQALAAGGVNLTPPKSGLAKDFGPSLEKAGFQTVPPKNYTPQKGDVIVFQPYPGQHLKAGHMQFYDGEEMVSDFKQKDKLWPSSSDKSAWKVHKPDYTIYRYPNVNAGNKGGDHQ